MLSFEIADNGHTIKIFLDEAGLKILSDTIEQLKKEESVDIMLRSPHCGGGDLSDTNPWGVEAVSEVLFSKGGD
jgi:hypothetical protein